MTYGGAAGGVGGPVPELHGRARVLLFLLWRHGGGGGASGGAGGGGGTVVMVVVVVVEDVVVVDGEWESVEKKSRNNEGFVEVKR
jgi:hypothetical protein